MKKKSKTIDLERKNFNLACAEYIRKFGADELFSTKHVTVVFDREEASLIKEFLTEQRDSLYHSPSTERDPFQERQDQIDMDNCTLMIMQLRRELEASNENESMAFKINYVHFHTFAFLLETYLGRLLNSDFSWNADFESECDKERLPFKRKLYEIYAKLKNEVLIVTKTLFDDEFDDVHDPHLTL